VTRATCPVCQSADGTSLVLPHDPFGACALFACGPCQLRFLGAWRGELPADEDYWADPEVGLAIYTAPEVVAELAAKYERVLDRLVPGLEGGQRLLDVGCGVGTFMDVARRRGLAVTGIDVADAPARFARSRGLDARTGPLAAQSFEPGSFDVVTLWDVIEHVDDPLALLRDIRRVLRPGGTLVLETPDEGTPLRLAARLAWRASLGSVKLVARCYYPAHRIYFTRGGLARSLERAGFGEPVFAREQSVRAKARLKGEAYGLSGHNLLTSLTLGLMSAAPFLGNKIVAASRAVVPAEHHAPTSAEVAA
jgi:SAM-dependent methyltransferase